MITSLDLVEEATITNSSGGRRVGEQAERAHVLFRVDLGMTRRESTGTVPVQVVRQRLPFPTWLFGLPESLARTACSVRQTATGRLVSVLSPRRESGRTGPVVAELELNDDDLPVRFVSFGSTHEVLDEVLVRWTRVDGHWFPASTERRWHSVQNLLTEAVTYRQVRINPALSATLFTGP